MREKESERQTDRQTEIEEVGGYPKMQIGVSSLPMLSFGKATYSQLGFGA